MLTLIDITKENLNTALDAFHKIFSWIPKNVDPYSPVLDGNLDELQAHYYLIYDEGDLVGITGSYSVPADRESAFLGWFGVVPEMRRNHYGSKILRLHEAKLIELGYKYSRLYTERYNNTNTRNFYERNGYTGEVYSCPEEPEQLRGINMVYSKSLGDWPLIPWNDRNMELAKETKMMYTEEQLQDPDLMKKIQNAVHA